MRAPRILATVAVLAVALVAGTLTLRSGGDAAPGTTSEERVADGPVVDWAPDDGDTAAAADRVSREGPAAEADGGEAVPPPPLPIPDDGVDGATAAHPADGPQTSLLAAAGQAVGPGVSGPAAGVTGDQARPPVDPDDVLPPTAARGGCLPDYGEPGQCLPSRPPSSSAEPGPWTCTEVRSLFAAGLAVAGSDSLGLDGDGDGVACGPGD